MPVQDRGPRRDRSPSATETTTVPAVFATATASVFDRCTRPELTVESLRPPQRLAPWSAAWEIEVAVDDTEVASGRLVLLYDPDGQDAWDGTLRLVGFVRAELDDELTDDPLLPEVGWSWLVDALTDAGAEHRALGGTVTRTSSARFGDIAGPRHTSDLELRASWTPTSADLSVHGAAFCALLASAAGLPPAGVSVVGRPIA